MVSISERKLKSFSFASSKLAQVSYKVNNFAKQFENNYKIENASHPNGAKRIISVEYGINDDDQNLLHEMNSDKILKLKQGTGISHVIIETSTQKNFEFK